MITNMKRSYSTLSSDGSGSSSSGGSSKDRFVRTAKHREGFRDDWKEQYPWLIPVHDRDEPEKVYGLMCELCQRYNTI